MDPPASPPCRRRLALGAAVLVGLGALLAGCGGGLYIGFGGEAFDDPPTVSLVASLQSAVPGQSLRLAAAARDDRGVAQVAFYRLDPGGDVLIGTDRSAPFELDTTIPAGARDEVAYFARATDSIGQRADSATVRVTVTGP